MRFGRRGCNGKDCTAPSIGRYMVAAPDICHGKPTFRGTCILLADMLDQVAAGLAWETIIEAWWGSITQEAIAEAVRLAGYDVGRQRKCRSCLGV
jgi:uncharacterized protein (DUF433 family)